MTLSDFLRATVCTVRPEGEPSVVVLAGPDGERFVAAWTGLDSMAQVLTNARWVSCSGADLVALLPDGVGLVVDPGTDRAYVLPASAIESAQARAIDPARLQL